jgi:hypothetical protein
MGPSGIASLPDEAAHRHGPFSYRKIISFIMQAASRRRQIYANQARIETPSSSIRGDNDIETKGAA